jgi:hypothetical protein
MTLQEGPENDEEPNEINWAEVAKRVVPFVEGTGELAKLYHQIKEEIPPLWNEIKKISGDSSTYAQAGDWGF